MVLAPNSMRPLRGARLAMLALLGFSSSVFAAHTASPLISDAVDENHLVSLAGQTHPLASPKYDQGAVADSMPLKHMLLQLQRSRENEASLALAIEDLQNPLSAQYHHWFTAKELGERFGPAQQDIETVSKWLSYHGFTVNSILQNRLTIDISGTAGQVREAFHTEIHNYVVNGKAHIANASDPAIPAALAPVVVGMVAMHNFMPQPALRKPKNNFTFTCTGCPFSFNGVPEFDEAPADLAVIYNVAPLYEQKQPITGKGQTVVVLEDTDINPADVATFRDAFSLSKHGGTFNEIHPGASCEDPGIGEGEDEAALDAEWAGAVAPDATVLLASCQDTATTFGAFVAAQNLLDTAAPPAIMSLSYEECEGSEGPPGNAFINALWQQAAGEGVSVFVSTGDNGAAGCDYPTSAYTDLGIAANGIASTPYNLAAGATDFVDTSEGKVYEYWDTTNSAAGGSAKSYVPEMPWNDSCDSSELFKLYGYTDGVTFCSSYEGSGFIGIDAGSGAPSFLYPKPSWQVGTVGMPNDGKRDLPDVSLFAANGFWYHAVLYCMTDPQEGGAPCDYTNPSDTLFNSAGGTSFVAPQLASIQALINQKAGGAQGNPAPFYYRLAESEFGTSSHPDKAALSACSSTKGRNISTACVFHDITVGNNAVPCYGKVNCYAPIAGAFGIQSTSDQYESEAYGSKKGWDFTTGLGTINVTNVVNNWP